MRLKKTGLVNLVIPANVKTIGKNAFDGSPNLTTLEIANNSELTTIDSLAFNGCLKLESVLFRGNSVLQSIGSNAFQSNKVLTSFILKAQRSWIRLVIMLLKIALI